MKLGEIKAQALMLMFSDTETLLCNSEDLPDRLAELRADSNYRDYLNSMTGSVNRCFSVIEQRGAIGTKQIDIDCADCEKTYKYCRINLGAIENLYRIQKIMYKNGKIFTPSCKFETESDGFILVDEKKNGTYTIVYTPKIKRIGILTSDNEELDVPDGIAEIIPYFIKGELQRNEDPSEALYSKQMFDDILSEIIMSKNSGNVYSESVYRCF